MSTIVIAVLAVVVLGAIAFFFLRKPEAPPPSVEPPKATEKPSEKKRESKAAEPPKEKKPSEKPEAKKKSEAPPAEPAEAKKSLPPEPAPAVEAKPEQRQEAPVKVEVPAPSAAAGAEKESVAALKKGLAETRGGFIARLAALFGRKKEIDPALLDEIQSVLITADLGPHATDKLLGRLRERLDRRELANEDAVWKALADEGRTILGAKPGPLQFSKPGPTTILIVGVNGVGKTTTIGKLASRFRDDGKKVVLAAGDTFRAAAVIQLEVWGKRVGCQVVKGKERADPGSVIFDAIKAAKESGADVVLADTAGRLHTKSNLMEEIKKVVRTAEKALERPVDHILLVLDATTGQNAIQQAQIFKEAIPVSGIVLTKLDGTAKGGVVLGIVDEHGIPVRFVGIGERVEDLREFDPETFVAALFEKPDEKHEGAAT
jgi:fused signal recognition particle receptor